MNLLDTTFLVIGSVVGSGIFLTTGYIAEYLPSPGMILIVWLVGGLVALSGALSFAELGAMFPKAGGQYVYIREAYGGWSGFLYGWGFFWFIMCGGIAALAVGFAEYLGYFLPFLSTKSYLLQLKLLGLPYSLSAGQLVAVAAILILSIVNYFGLKSGLTVQNIFTFLRLVSVAAIVIFGLLIGKKSGLSSLSHLFIGSSGFSLDFFKFFGLALIAVFWTYDGWYAVNCTAEEIRNPQKNLPLSLILGTLIVTASYLLVNVVYILALPVAKMKGVARIGELASTYLFGSSVTVIISAAIMVSIFGCLSATIIYGPRVYYAMAEDGAFFQSMRYIHPRFHVPSKAIIGQAIWSSLLCLTGTYKDLYEYVVFALVIFFALTGLAIIVLRFKRPKLKRPYRAWGYPYLPLLFIIINVAVFFNTVVAQPLKSAIGLIMLLLGLPAFLYWKKKNRLNNKKGIKS